MQSLPPKSAPSHCSPFSSFPLPHMLGGAPPPPSPPGPVLEVVVIVELDEDVVPLPPSPPLPAVPPWPPTPVAAPPVPPVGSIAVAQAATPTSAAITIPTRVELIRIVRSRRKGSGLVEGST